MKRVLPMILIAIFLTSLVITPAAFTPVSADIAPFDFAISSQVGSHTARVAIYDEDDTTTPVAAGASAALSGLTNNVDEVETLLEAAGHSVTLLTTQDILDHELITANYDVFVLVNNLPRVSITKLVKEFWLGGGGLLTFHKAFSFLNYESIIWPGLDADGYGLLWGNLTADILNVNARHPAMKDYHINDTVSERASDWTVISEMVLDGSDVWLSITPLLKNLTNADFIYGLAMDSRYEGGRLVHLPGDGSSIPTDFESIIVDSVEWLVPLPKGRIAYDLTHSPRLAVDEWDDLATIVHSVNIFTQFRSLAVNHTYTFDKLYPSASGNLTAERLANYDILIIVWPDLNYSQAEYLAVEEWVNNGGSLLVLGDRTGLTGGGPGNIYINTMLQNFDMSLGTTDVLTFGSMSPGTHLTLERCTSLMIGYRNYLSVLGSATPIWFDGADPVVAGQSFGQGRVILSADMNIFDNEELPEESNALFALNVLNWLTANDATILVYTSWDGFHNDAATALRDLGLPYQMLFTNDYVDNFLDSKSWDLFIVDQSNTAFANAQLDALFAYVDAGGKLIMSYYDMDNAITHPLWSTLGVEFSADLGGEPSLYIWDSTHPIFNQPNDRNRANFSTGVFFSDDGDTLTVLPGFTALAGSTADIQAGNALIVVNNTGQTLYNGYLIDTCTGDEDDSTYRDSIELWQNEIVFMTTEPPGNGGGLPFDLDPITLAIIGAAVALVIVIGAVVSRRRSGGQTPKKKPKKKITKKKKK
ncbi:MAG: DUF4350 domain-containing protein [Candidatus Thorarchaeota archaeon]